MERGTALVTGANGFVGHAVCRMLEHTGWDVRRAVRRARSGEELSGFVEIGDITETRWIEPLAGVDAIVHLAGRAHVSSKDDPASFFRINTDASLRLAEAAARLGVRRFVYVSTAKVLGEWSPHGKPFTEADQSHPVDPYAQSKLDAEAGLRRIAGQIEVVIVRPPLVYGPQVRANFLRLLQLVDRGAWLPLGKVANRRSLIYVDNLASAIAACLDHPGAAGRTYLVSDGEDVSTAELIRRIAAAMGRTARCAPLPPAILWSIAAGFGRKEQARRVLGSLQIDSGLIRRELNWVPPFTLDDGLAATVAWFRDRSKSETASETIA